VATGFVNEFEAMLRFRTVKDRWQVLDSRHSLVIKHVRVTDFQDAMAVTIDGVTSFDPKDFKTAEQRVQDAGGSWVW
jgi:hypothetical protein